MTNWCVTTAYCVCSCVCVYLPAGTLRSSDMKIKVKYHQAVEQKSCDGDYFLGVLFLTRCGMLRRVHLSERGRRRIFLSYHIVPYHFRQTLYAGLNHSFCLVVGDFLMHSFYIYTRRHRTSQWRFSTPSSLRCCFYFYASLCVFTDFLVFCLFCRFYHQWQTVSNVFVYVFLLP